jgi:hypothetical protein
MVEKENIMCAKESEDITFPIKKKTTLHKGKLLVLVVVKVIYYHTTFHLI